MCSVKRHSTRTYQWWAALWRSNCDLLVGWVQWRLNCEWAHSGGVASNECAPAPPPVECQFAWNGQHWFVWWADLTPHWSPPDWLLAKRWPEAAVGTQWPALANGGWWRWKFLLGSCCCCCWFSIRFSRTSSSLSSSSSITQCTAPSANHRRSQITHTHTTVHRSMFTVFL